MSDLWFVIAGYGVILGGLAAYAITLVRRLTDDPARRAARAAVVGLIAAVDIPIVHFSVIWWRGLHQGPTIGDPGKILNPSAPLQFVAALLAMLGAFTLVWGYLVIRRYQLARVESEIEGHVRLARVTAARRAGGVASAATATPGEEPAS